MNLAFPIERLRDVVERIDYGVTASAVENDTGCKFLRITDIQDGHVDWASVPYCRAPEAKLRQALLEDRDIVFARTGATTGKSFLVRSPPVGAVFASYLIRVRPSRRIDASYLAHFFQSPVYWAQIQQKTQGAAQGGVNATSLSELRIPLAPLDEQRRIAAILDKADALRRKRRCAINLLESLTQSIFIEMFGHPTINPRNLPTQPLSEVATFTSGGTPSKDVEEFWDGDIPWVSPKDMKVTDIFDAEDHVSESAIAQTSLKVIEPKAILIVVRGMILAHTAPMAIARNAVTINQDMKAIRFDTRIDPVFGFWCLKAQASYILSKVSSAAHGTRRLEMVDVERLSILVPSAKEQRDFVMAATQVAKTLREHSIATFQMVNALLPALQHLAFSGELK